jgi:hypothetical protein
MQPHTDAEQVWPAPHWRPQVPQLLTSVLTLMHSPSHSAKPSGQSVQVPATHRATMPARAVHMLSHIPQ